MEFRIIRCAPFAAAAGWVTVQRMPLPASSVGS
nr:MAG TPA: hypothetical protein [Caudoviricetes sp.]